MDYQEEQAEKIAKRRGKVDELAERDHKAMRDVMSSVEGRRTIWRVLLSSEIGTNAFTGNSSTFFNLGKQHVGQLLTNELMDHCHDLYVVMVNENRKKRET